MNKGKYPSGKISVVHNKAKKSATIEIDGYIGASYWDDAQNTKERIKNELKDIANIKADVIYVNINSLGGDVNHGISIHDLLAEHPAKVVTKITGMTASAATVIALAGDERKMSDNALGLIHQGSLMAWGNINDLEKAIEMLEVVNERISNMYAKTGGQDKKVYTDLMAENNGQGKWIDAEQMKEIGLVTEIYEPTKMAAAVDLNYKAYNITPPPAEMIKINNQAEPENNGVLATLKSDLLTLTNKVGDLIDLAWTGESKPKNTKAMANTNDELTVQMDALKTEVENLKKEKGDLSTQVDNLTQANNDLLAENTQLKDEVAELKDQAPAPTTLDGDDGGSDGDKMPAWLHNPMNAHLKERWINNGWRPGKKESK